jgi:PAS domain S-box-containing protein
MGRQGAETADKERLLDFFRKADIHFYNFFHSCPIPTVISTVKDGTILDINDSMLKMLNYKREELIGATAVGLKIWVNPESRKSIAARRENGSLKEITILLKAKNGDIRETVVSTEPFLIEGENYLISSFCDITEIKQAERRIQESEERLYRIVNLANDWIWEIDDKGVLIFASSRIREVTGYAEEELIGKSFRYLMTAEEADRAVEFLRAYWRERRPFTFFENTIIHKDGRELHVEASAMPIFDAGTFKGYMGASRDITERKRAEMTLKAREEELEVKSIHLEETNSALKVLLRQREKDKEELEEKVVMNCREMVQPYLEKMKATNLDAYQKAYLGIIETHLTDIISSFSQRMRSTSLNFTPGEIRVASLVRDGKNTKEISKLLDISKSAVEFHRNRIRTKLGINNKKVNLRTCLLFMK